MSFRSAISGAVMRNRGVCVTISSFTCSVILWGFGYTFTLLFVYIQEEFESSTTATGWIGSSYYGLGSTLAIVIPLLVKRFKYHTVFLLGIFLAGLSLLATSFVQSIHALFITYGVFYATGTCIAYYATLDLVKLYYCNSPYLTRATYFSTMGATVGFLVQSPLVGKILTVTGWRGVLRIYAAITIIVGLIVSYFMHEPDNFRDVTSCSESPTLETKETFLDHKTNDDQRVDKGDQQKTEDVGSAWKIFTFPEAWYFVIGMVITSTATMFCYINIVDFMKYIGISTYVSSWILVATAGAEVAGKIFFAMTGDRMPFAKMYIMAPTNILFAGMMVILIYARTTMHMTVLLTCLGLLKSVFHAMPWTATIELLGPHRNTQATILGCLGFGIGAFSGSFVSGLSYDHTGSYDVGLLVSCGMYIVGALFFQAAPLHQKIFAPERYLMGKKAVSPSVSDKEYKCIVDSYITTV